MMIDSVKLIQVIRSQKENKPKYNWFIELLKKFKTLIKNLK